MNIQANHRINRVESLRIRRLIDENNYLKKKLDEIEKTQENKRNIIEVFNKLLQDKKIQDNMSKEQLLDIINTILKSL